MNITDIKIRLTSNKDDKLKAVASIVIDDAIAIHGIKIVNGRDGLFLSMPSRKNKEGDFVDIVHPIKNEIREELQTKVLEAYKIEAATAENQ